MTKLIQNILFLLGSEKRRRLPKFLAFFLIVSCLDLIGIALIGAYVAFLASPETFSDGWMAKIVNILEAPISDVALTGGIALLAVLFVRAFATIILNRAIFRFAAQILKDIRFNSMKHYQSLPYIEHLNRSTAVYIRNVAGYTTNVSTATSGLLLVASEGIVAIAAIGMLFLIDWVTVGILIILFSGAYLVFDRFSGKLLEHAGLVLNSAGKEAIKAVHEGFEGFKEVRILGREGLFQDSLRDASQQIGKAQVFSKLMNIAPRLFIEISMIMFLLVYIGITLAQGMPLSDSFPMLAMFGFASLRIGPSFSLMISMVGQLRVLTPSICVLADDLKCAVDNPVANEDRIITREKFGHLNLARVRFRYPDAKNDVLCDVNMKILAGDSIGLVGTSGSGKTTLVDLMLGLLEPKSGEVFFNNRSLKDSIGAWTNCVAYLPQDSFIMDESVWKNVTLSQKRSEVDFERLANSLGQARLTGVVDELPEGIETCLGDKGIRISGGQKQRISLARAFYHDREVLVLDEATTALDDETEKEIIYEVASLKGKVTMIIITHRAPILRHCDHIYRLDQGFLSKIEVSEFGDKLD